MLYIVWRFRAKPDHLTDFRHAYDAEGRWAQLFRRSPEYRGTQLWQDTADPHSFLVVDTWLSKEAWTRFREEFAPEYRAFDLECEDLTEEEVKIGEYTRLG